MRKELRRYLLGMEMTAWQREQILINTEKMYQRRRISIIIQTGIITCAVIVLFTFVACLICK